MVQIVLDIVLNHFTRHESDHLGHSLLAVVKLW